MVTKQSIPLMISLVGIVLAFFCRLVYVQLTTPRVLISNEAQKQEVTPLVNQVYTSDLVGVTFEYHPYLSVYDEQAFEEFGIRGNQVSVGVGEYPITLKRYQGVNVATVTNALTAQSLKQAQLAKDYIKEYAELKETPEEKQVILDSIALIDQKTKSGFYHAFSDTKLAGKPAKQATLIIEAHERYTGNIYEKRVVLLSDGNDVISVDYPIDNTANDPYSSTVLNSLRIQSGGGRPTPDWPKYMIESIKGSLLYPEEYVASSNIKNSTALAADEEYWVSRPDTDQIFLTLYVYKSTKTPQEWWQTEGQQKFEELAKSVSAVIVPAETIKLTYTPQQTTLAGKEALFVRVESSYETPNTPKARAIHIVQSNGNIVMFSSDITESSSQTETSESIRSNFVFY